MTYKKTLTGLIIGTVISVFAVTTALATNQDALFSSNHILFYNPSAPTCDVGSSSGGSSDAVGKVVDYKNREILNDAQVKAINDNKPFYEKAAQKVGIPWEMIAVIHVRESGLGRTNPDNGQGIYQFFDKRGGPYPTGAVSDEEFQRQTDFVAQFILEKAGSKGSGLKSGDDNAVKYTFFAYNGIASAYIDQALKLGFNDEQAGNGEGSPYVMNKADEKRDPDSNSSNWGQIKQDNGDIEYPANKDHGAFVTYAALKGKISSSCSGSGTIDGNGLSEEDAKKFMMAYGENKNNFSALAVQLGGNPWSICDGGGGSNCVTFSAFFNNAFTDMPKIGYPNGVEVVSTLAKHGVSTGTEPRIFSTFSNANLPIPGNGPDFGHTGIVLGKKSDGSLIVGHASCSHTGSGRGDGTYAGGGAGFITIGRPDQGKTWLTYVKPHIFAYPSNVNVEAIKQFIDKGFVDNSSDTIKP